MSNPGDEVNDKDQGQQNPGDLGSSAQMPVRYKFREMRLILRMNGWPGII